MEIREATKKDIDSIEKIYETIHDEEEKGMVRHLYHFMKIMRTTDLQESEQARGKGYYDVTIKKCLWHTACVENDCESYMQL